MIISPNSLAHHLIENASKHPEKKAVVIDGDSYTYQSFAEIVEKYILFLLKNEISKGKPIAVKISSSIKFCAFLFACSALGVAFVPIDPTIPQNQQDKCLKQLKINKIITDRDLDNINADSPDNICPELSGDETFVISLTSGSTGKPKPIELTQNLKLKRARAHIALYNLNENDIILASTPLFHSLAERLLIMSIVSGGTCVIIDDFNASEWFNIVNREKVTFTISEASQLGQIAPLLLSPFVPDISSLKIVVSSSSLLENHVRKELIDKLDSEVYEIYGTSETSTLTSINIKENERINSVGKALDFASIRIQGADENGIGEISCQSELMFKGYYHENDLTNQAFENGFFKTGDLGRLDENGFLYYCGRKDELIKINGINIYPFNIEKTVAELDGIKECAVFNYHDELKGNVIALAAVKKTNSDLNRDTIRSFCKSNLSKTMIPEYIFVVKELPKNAMGKVVKNKIYENIIRYQMTGDDLYE